MTSENGNQCSSSQEEQSLNNKPNSGLSVIQIVTGMIAAIFAQIIINAKIAVPVAVITIIFLILDFLKKKGNFNFPWKFEKNFYCIFYSIVIMLCLVIWLSFNVALSENAKQVFLNKSDFRIITPINYEILSQKSKFDIVGIGGDIKKLKLEITHEKNPSKYCVDIIPKIVSKKWKFNGCQLPRTGIYQITVNSQDKKTATHQIQIIEQKKLTFMQKLNNLVWKALLKIAKPTN